MAVGSILSNALSALQTNQTALGTTASNIANVNTPGYKRRMIELQPVQYGSTSGGVQIAEIRRAAATFLARESLKVTSSAARYDAEAQVHDSIQGLFGRPDQNSSLSGRIDQLFTAISDLSIDPTSTIRRQSFLTSLGDTANMFSGLFEHIQSIRSDTEQQVTSTVTAINEALKRIDNLNPQIQREVLSGNDAAGLRDQRDQAVHALAELMNVRTAEQENGKLYVTTQDGVPLVTEQLFQLDYTPPGPISSQTIFAPIVIRRLDRTSGSLVPQGTALEPHLGDGRLRGLLNMRSQVLPNLAKEIGELAGRFADSLNAAHNENAASPAANTLTGRNTGLLDTDAYGFTGKTSFVVTDSTGALVRRVDVDFDAGTYSINGGGSVAFGGTTVADMVAAINTGLGADGNLTFSNGVMTLDAALPANGVAVVQDATTPSDRGGRGFAHFFGLNDLFQASVPSTFDTGLSATDASGFAPGQSFELVLRGPNSQTAIDYTYTIAPGSTIGDIVSDLNAAGTGLGGYLSFSLDANGKLTATPTAAFKDYRIEVANDMTARGGTAQSLTQLFGIGDNAQMDHARNLSLRTNVASDPSKLALAQIDLSPATAPGDIVLGAGDNRGALALSAVQDQAIDFSPAGDLGNLRATLSSYAGTVLSDAGHLAAQADSLRDENQTLQSDINDRMTSIEGVNLDEELANMIQYQQSYNAAARLIQTSNEAFQALLNAV
jgi:flagellar hook-associated protein 1 FlgK